jgi:TRAP-type C4-dicarboxylate transport system substrate-binding protein
MERIFWLVGFFVVLPQDISWGLTLTLTFVAMTLIPSGAMAAEAVLVHDIAAPHPRYKNFYKMLAEVVERTNGLLTISINPGGKVLYPGQASLDAVRSGQVPLAFVNSAFLQSVHPSLGFLNLPFSLNDETFKTHAAEALIHLMQTYVKPSGLEVLGVMRGADTLFVFKKHLQVRRPEDLKGVKIRVAGPGIYQEVVRSLGAEPIVIPAIAMKSALAGRGIEGMITSPGGWNKHIQEAPYGSLVPGLIFYTYFLIADQSWLGGLPAEQRQALMDAARLCVTEKWRDMQKDDGQLISTLVDKKGASFWSLPAQEVAPWKERVEEVTWKFTQAYPEVMKEYRAILSLGDR